MGDIEEIRKVFEKNTFLSDILSELFILGFTELFIPSDKKNMGRIVYEHCIDSKLIVEIDLQNRCWSIKDEVANGELKFIPKTEDIQPEE